MPHPRHRVPARERLHLRAPRSRPLVPHVDPREFFSQLGDGTRELRESTLASTSAVTCASSARLSSNRSSSTSPSASVSSAILALARTILSLSTSSLEAAAACHFSANLISYAVMSRRRALAPSPARRLNRASTPPGPRSRPRARREGSSPRFPPEPWPFPTRRRANPQSLSLRR